MKVLNFNDPYVDSKGNVNNLEDVLSDISVDLTDYAKKTDIPSTLPANGGNADTVNNHTVESDVPVEAKFTDTIYDDTEVKGSIAKLNESLSVIGKCKNLLNPTLNTSTLNGVTCTANGDGTYTLNGTANSQASFELVTNFSLEKGKKYKILGCPNGGGESTYLIQYKFSTEQTPIFDTGNGKDFLEIDSWKQDNIWIIVQSGATVSNLVFKPMITTDLSATYDDFVPYTGDGDTLTHDVAEIKNDLGDLSFSASGTTLTITNGVNTWTLNANS